MQQHILRKTKRVRTGIKPVPDGLGDHRAVKRKTIGRMRSLSGHSLFFRWDDPGF